MSQAKNPAPLRGADLIAEYRRLNAARETTYLLLFTMPGCESCDCLKEDLRDIAAASAFQVVLNVSVDADDQESCGLAGHYGLKDFPTAIVVRAGRAVSGWSGYDRAVAAAERRAALSIVVERALLRASEMDEVIE